MPIVSGFQGSLIDVRGNNLSPNLLFVKDGRGTSSSRGEQTALDAVQPDQVMFESTKLVSSLQYSCTDYQRQCLYTQFFISTENFGEDFKLLNFGHF